MYDFKGKTVLITGAAKGQGRGVALGFAKEGANVIAVDLGQKIEYPAYNRACGEDLENLKKEIEALGGACEICAADVRDAAEVEAAVKKGVERFGTVDILFSNAGICATPGRGR